MSAALEKVRVLVVDDNRDMRALLRRLLGTGGIRQVHEAEDGASGLEMLRDNECDMVLTDLAMTPMDGLEFTRKLRAARDTLNPSIPVVMISGHTEKHRVEAARDAGVTEFLVKPITPRNLFGRINDILERPRAFVRTEGYFGPDRRRRATPNYDGPFRRDGDQRE
jgi:two-component system, chemotaxis family, chemotaxis protein CheY